MKLHDEFMSLKNDAEKWRWIIDNQNKGIIIMLDNDDTYGVIEYMEDSPIFQFDNYIGWPDGIFDLLSAIGIKSDYV
jgi:hypothetical protein